MAKTSIRAKIKTAWEYKRAALLWTVLVVMVFVAVAALFMHFSDAYISSGNLAQLFLEEAEPDGMVYMLLDDYVLMSFLLLLYALCAMSFLTQLWNDDVADYYILLLLWSLTFYILYGLNLFNPGGGSLHYLVRTMADTLYQQSVTAALCAAC